MTGAVVMSFASTRPEPAEVLFEVVRIGAHLRVAALDPASNTEVFVVGPARHGEAALKQLAASKLARTLARDDRRRL